MKHILLLTLFLLTTLLANKTDFSVIVNKPFNAALFDITQDYDRTLTAVGFSKEYKNSSNASRSYSDAFEYLESVSENFGSQMHMIKVDKSAQVVFSKHTGLSKFNEAVAVVKTPSNGYFVGGYTLDGSLLVLKLNANGDRLFSKTFGTKNYDRMNNLILMSDGGVLAVGSSVTSRSTSDDMFETGLGNNDIYLTRFTKEGERLWSKKYGTMHDDRGVDAVEARDGSILVVSTTSYNKNRDVSFMRITENGNKIWLKHYQDQGNNNNTVIPKKIIRLKDNNFVVALSQYNDMQKEHIRFVKFDLYQNILIDKEMHTTYPSGINDIKEFSDGSFMAVGYVKDTFNTDGLAMVLDSNLALLTQEHYGGENYDKFDALHILHNSQVAVAGVHTSDDSQETNMWITRLNKDATLSQVSTQASSFYERLCKILEDEIRSKKLQVKKDLTIELSDKTLYFNVGEYKLTSSQELFLKKLSKKLMDFLYLNRELIDTFEVSGHTSSEWGSDFTKGYLNNEKLSLNRSYETISYIFNNVKKDIQRWLSNVLKGSGYSYSKKVIFNHIEDKAASRRVSFKILLK
ncbi:MAG: hypothetical protein U9N39_02415 [Campylobacterota bacterium]|nr:hypothetical protein [Campylobacterota bacterium]